MRKYPT